VSVSVSVSVSVCLSFSVCYGLDVVAGAGTGAKCAAAMGNNCQDDYRSGVDQSSVRKIRENGY